MTPRRWLAALALALAAASLAACRRAGSDGAPDASADGASRADATKPAPRPTSRYPQAPLAPVRVEEVTHAEAKGLVTAARTMLAKVTPADGIRVALQWRGDKLAKDEYALGRWLDDLRVQVTGPDGKKVSLAPAPGEPAQADRARLYPRRTEVLVIDREGLRSAGRPAQSRRWKDAPADVLTAPGKYEVAVAGAFAIEGGALAFETGKLAVEIVAPSPDMRTLEELTRAALVAVFDKPEYVDETLRNTGEGGGFAFVKRPYAVDDTSGNRWIWIEKREPNGHVDLHVAVAPAGEVVAFDERHEFHCVAAGTPIATPAGHRPIETLAPGDPVVGWDAAAGREVVTRVSALVERPASPVVRLGELRVTAGHPVLAGGAWRPAGELAPGDAVVRRGGAIELLGAFGPSGELAVVYDLAVEWPHTYFAAGLVVHNKTAPQPGPSDPLEWIFDRPRDPSWHLRTWWGRK